MSNTATAATPITESIDDCEICGKTAVCTPHTFQDGDLLADMLICHDCRLCLTLMSMGRRARGRVDGLSRYQQ